jgi:major membrane immunogen (membrane-anchored lipoprotein)
VDFREIRVGGGVRYTIKQKLAIEISGGVTVDRRYDFHKRDLEFKSDAAPYVQIGFGLKF